MDVNTIIGLLNSLGAVKKTARVAVASDLAQVLVRGLRGDDIGVVMELPDTTSIPSVECSGRVKDMQSEASRNFTRTDMKFRDRENIAIEVTGAGDMKEHGLQDQLDFSRPGPVFIILGVV